MELIQIPVNDLLLMNAEQVVFNVQNSIHTGHKGLSAFADLGVFPLRNLSVNNRRARKRLACHIRAVRPRPREPYQADRGSLPDGLQRDLLAKVHLIFILHLHVHILPPPEQLRHLAVFPTLGQPPPGNREQAEPPAHKLFLDLFLEDAITDTLIMQILHKPFQRDLIPAVLRREQARKSAHPVLRQEKMRLRLHGRLALRRLRYPRELTERARKDYLAYLQGHAGEALEAALAERDGPGLRFLLDSLSPDQEVLSAALALARALLANSFGPAWGPEERMPLGTEDDESKDTAAGPQAG